eukprot:31100-Pelagococcus_subviridis.AAC.2
MVLVHSVHAVIHDVQPHLERRDLEQREHGRTDVIVRVRVRVLPHRVHERRLAQRRERPGGDHRVQRRRRRGIRGEAHHPLRRNCRGWGVIPPNAVPAAQDRFRVRRRRARPHVAVLFFSVFRRVDVRRRRRGLDARPPDAAVARAVKVRPRVGEAPVHVPGRLAPFPREPRVVDADERGSHRGVRVYLLAAMQLTDEQVQPENAEDEVKDEAHERDVRDRGDGLKQRGDDHLHALVPRGDAQRPQRAERAQRSNPRRALPIARLRLRQNQRNQTDDDDVQRLEPRLELAPRGNLRRVHREQRRGQHDEEDDRVLKVLVRHDEMQPRVQLVRSGPFLRDDLLSLRAVPLHRAVPLPLERLFPLPKRPKPRAPAPARAVGRSAARVAVHAFERRPPWVAAGVQLRVAVPLIQSLFLRRRLFFFPFRARLLLRFFFVADAAEVIEQDGEEEVQDDVVAKNRQREEVQNRGGVRRPHPVVHHRVPVLSREHLEDGNERPVERVEVMPRDVALAQAHQVSVRAVRRARPLRAAGELHPRVRLRRRARDVTVVVIRTALSQRDGARRRRVVDAVRVAKLKLEPEYLHAEKIEDEYEQRENAGERRHRRERLHDRLDDVPKLRPRPREL